MFEILLLWFVTIIFLTFYSVTKNFNYWKKRNVPYPTPLPLFGNYLEYILLKKPSGLICQELCKMYKKEPYFGTYFGTDPALVILDPEIIKLVFTKDFHYFNSRELMDYTYKETLTRNVFFQHGETWKTVRNHMTPMFSSAKLKNMFYLIEKCALALEDTLEYKTSESDVFEAKTMMIRYTMDCICSCGFGVEAGTLNKNSGNNPFTIMGKAIFSNTFASRVSVVTRWVWPQIFYGLGFKLFSPAIHDFFNKLLIEVFRSRNYSPTQRNDFVDLLLNQHRNETVALDGNEEDKPGDKKISLVFDDAMMVSQCMAFFGAGFETSAGALSFTIYELAKNPKAQKRAQEEIDEYLKKKNNKLVDDCVTELPFLEACVYETMRLYPVLPIITREVVQNYTFPNGLQLDRGTRIHLPTYHLHHDPDLFPDPEEYKPERFLPCAEHVIKPYTFFPFGEGPRTCIGLRLSKLQVMPGLITILKSYNLELTKETPRKLEFETSSLVLQPTSHIPLRVSKRTDARTYNRKNM